MKKIEKLIPIAIWLLIIYLILSGLNMATYKYRYDDYRSIQANAGAILVFAGVFLIGVIYYLHNTRYNIQISGEGKIYKIDRKTGQIWFIDGAKEELLVKPNKEG